jgi:cytochrome c oxidase cbb3-type subunit III
MIEPAPPHPAPQSSTPGVRRHRRVLWGLLLVLSAAAALLIGQQVRHDRFARRLLATDGDVIIRDRALTAYAAAQARPLYAEHCAACHAADMTGNASLGAPNLIDTHWLYGDGSVFEIERTLLYGVRSEYGKSHNVTDMPAFGLTGRLSETEIRNLVQFLLQLSGQPHQAGAATQGRAVYYDAAKANCSDCHGDTGGGNSNYGAPDLTINVWNSGGDAQSLYDAIYFGQHRIMPGWIGTLSLEQIRALAVFVYAKSHGVTDG